FRRRIAAVLAAGAVVATGCTTATPQEVPATDAPAEVPTTAASVGVGIPPSESAALRNHLDYQFPPAPAVPEGAPDDALVEILDTVFASVAVGVPVEGDTIREISTFGDARAAWALTDLLQFLAPSDNRNAAIEAYTALVGRTSDDPVAQRSTWQSFVDHLVAWDLPALPGYQSWKRDLFTAIEPRWYPFFEDTMSDIDWRLVSWGGVFIDDRALGDAAPCPGGCIPALDDPAVTDAAGGDWYPDDSLIFGITINGESRAYPKNMMEVHEMVNDTLGGRRIGVPYCTLCGSAQAYFTDDVPDGVETPILRTSGLLSRSNKVMYDLVTFSVLDTFTGEALSGPLQDAGLVLNQASVVTSTWGEWKTAHPDTTIIAQDGGIGRGYSSDPLRGRDDLGPIFPIGNVDERLEAQTKVFGVFDQEGMAVAFPVDAVRSTLADGQRVVLHGIEVVADGSGVRAVDADGAEVVGHEAFWFAWSQFHPDTVVWAAE
ncbi:MAG: DUF3179 domain-containing (seleno)protein, partial [Acidimicrobiia bacterium]